MSKDELNENELANVVGGLTSADSSAAQTSSLSELSTATQLSLQSAMDSQTRMIQTVSNILKKASDTDSSIISNLK